MFNDPTSHDLTLVIKEDGEIITIQKEVTSSVNQLILDNTMLSAFHNCPKQFYWRHVLGLVPSGEVSPALLFGTAIHSALETFYLGGSTDEAEQVFLREFPRQDGEDKRTPELGLTILHEYWKKWLPERWKVLQVETALQWELSADLVFCGKVDLIVEQLGEVYVVDHKTASSISGYTPKPNHQFSGYISGVRTLGLPAVGAIINLIGVLKTKTDYHRLITSRTDSELESWRLDVLKTKTRIDDCLHNGHWEMQTTSCRFCSYKDLCSSLEESLELVKNSRYTVDRWQPWVSKEKESQ